MTGGMPFCPTVSVVSAICFVLCKKRTKPSRSPPDSTDGPRFQTVFTFLHNRLEALTLRPFEQLISECINAGDTLFSILVNSLSSPPLSQFCRLCLRSAFHPSQSTSLCRTDTQLSVSSLSLSLSLSGAGGLLQTAVGGQDQSRQQEGEEGLSGALKGRLAASSSPSCSLFISIQLML